MSKDDKSNITYEGLAGIGDHIRAYDFPANKDCYIEGEIMAIPNIFDQTFYEVLVFASKETLDTRVGEKMLVPQETEFDKIWGFERITLIKSKKSKPLK